MILSFRRYRSALSIAALLLIGCQQAVSDDESTATDTSPEIAPVHPFAGRGPGQETDATENVDACVVFRLEAADVHRGQAVTSRVHVENHCETPASVLTAPLEVVVLESSNEPTTWLMSHALYAVLYVQPKEGAEPRLNYLTDGGLKVLHLPSYFRVPPGAAVEIGVVGDHEALRNLEVGSYWLVLQTPVVLDPEAGPMDTPFDLGRPVEEYNLLRSHDSGEQATLMPPGAVRMGAATTLRVLPSL